MRRFIRLAAAAVLALGLVTGCATASESTPPPSPGGVSAAQTFLASAPSPGPIGDQSTTGALVLSVNYKSDAWSTTWSATVLTQAGANVVLENAISADTDRLHAMMAPGDYIAYTGTDIYVSDLEVRVEQKAAVPVS